ncbi:MAG TPA: hypothetical protein VKY74_08660 [Chloroflexia bacterium]|nr:hypothetical protein [Chloroflexia bacterium]
MADKPTAADDYEQMLLLEDLESLAEEMDEVGVADIAEVRRWLAQPRTDAQLGVPSAADQAALQSILDRMDELAVTSRAALATRIRGLQEQMDWSEG